MRTGLCTTVAATAAVIARGEDGLEMAWVDCAFLVVVVAIVLLLGVAASTVRLERLHDNQRYGENEEEKSGQRADDH